MKNRVMAIVILACLISILLISTSCVNGRAINSKSFGFNKGVTGKAAEPIAPMKDSDKPAASGGDTPDRKDD